MTDAQRLKRYKYHVVYCGAPYGFDENGEQEFGHIVYSSNTEDGIWKFLEKNRDNASLYGRNSYIFDSEDNRRISHELNDYALRY